MAGSKSKTSVSIAHPVESLEKATKALGSHVASELGRKGLEDTWAQFIGLQGKDHHAQPGKKKEKKAGEHKEQKSVGATVVDMILGQEYAVNAQSGGHAETGEKPEKAPLSVEPGINYHRDIVKSSENASRRQLTEMERKFEQIHDELERLVDSSNQIVQEEFGGVALESTPKEVGKYHINFLDWMLIAIQTARQKVEDSGAWLSAMKGKKGKKGYWGMFKQHGTSFGMSNERQVATQTG